MTGPLGRRPPAKADTRNPSPKGSQARNVEAKTRSAKAGARTRSAKVGAETRSAQVDAWSRAAIRGLKPYYQAPLAGDPLRLDQNTNLGGNNPALRTVKPTALDVAQYPTRDSDQLRAALARFHGLDAAHFVVGSGGDELLGVLAGAFGEPGTTLAMPWPTYSLYPHFARTAGLKLVGVPTLGGFARLDVDALLKADARMTWVATPNNPTGAAFAVGDIERLVQESRGIVLVDEAYIEYAGLERSFLPRIEEFDNLVVMRTFSKAYGLAGLRIGYLAANRTVAERLNLAKPPYNLNVYSEQVAIAALQEQAWLDAGVRTVKTERERLRTALTGLGFKVHPSAANFLLTDPPLAAPTLLDALREAGILARTFPSVPELARTIRFTVGLRKHNDRLVGALRKFLGDTR